MPKITLLREVKKPYKSNHDKHKPINLNNRSSYWSKYYQSHAWKSSRLAYKLEHPLCERCLSKGIITPAKDIHHKCPFGLGKTQSERMSLLLDSDNYVALCNKCHHDIHTNKDKEYLWTLREYYNNKQTLIY